jgi:hypothetical protein
MAEGTYTPVMYCGANGPVGLAVWADILFVSFAGNMLGRGVLVFGERMTCGVLYKRQRGGRVDVSVWYGVGGCNCWHAVVLAS